MAKIIIRQTTEVPDYSSSDLDIELLLQQGGEILKREIKNLMMESSGKKLSPTSARDLCNYIKLLSELRAEQKESLSDMTDEALTALSGSTSQAKPEAD